MLLWIYLVVETLPMCRDLYIISYGRIYYLWVDDMATWCVCYISAVISYLLKFYTCQLWTIWRRDVYFLNIYYIRVIYRFNRSRTLHLTHPSITKTI